MSTIALPANVRPTWPNLMIAGAKRSSGVTWEELQEACRTYASEKKIHKYPWGAIRRWVLTEYPNATVTEQPKHIALPSDTPFRP